MKRKQNMRHTWTKTAGEFLLSLFFPRRCPVCQEIVTPVGEKICPSCRRRIAFIKEPVCRKCGKEILRWEDELCYDCRKYRRSFHQGVSLMQYDHIGKITMKAFKYENRPEYGAFYAEELLRQYGHQLIAFGADAIVPVPVHWSRQRMRGYNQAEVLARELARGLGIPVKDHWLIRRKKTEAQKTLDAGGRQRNLEQAMVLRGSEKGIRRVILVDDIYTTGSTAEACTRVLQRGGVEAVMVVTVCIGSNM